MSPADRQRFDEILEGVLDSLPPALHDLLELVPLIVDDRPEPALLRELGMETDELLCGLHSGIALTERSVEHSGALPEDIRIYREGIVELAGGWRGRDAEQRITREVRITVLHEIGHHFGLDEDDLANLGYD